MRLRIYSVDLVAEFCCLLVHPVLRVDFPVFTLVDYQARDIENLLQQTLHLQSLFVVATQSRK
jgi:hypothetical protein